jgi:hypothetical protein
VYPSSGLSKKRSPKRFKYLNLLAFVEAEIKQLRSPRRVVRNRTFMIATCPYLESRREINITSKGNYYLFSLRVSFRAFSVIFAIISQHMHNIFTTLLFIYIRLHVSVLHGPSSGRYRHTYKHITNIVSHRQTHQHITNTYKQPRNTHTSQTKPYIYTET